MYRIKKQTNILPIASRNFAVLRKVIYHVKNQHGCIQTVGVLYVIFCIWPGLFILAFFYSNNTGTNTCAFQSITFLSLHFVTPAYHAVMLNHMFFSFQIKFQTAYIAFCFKIGVTIKAQWGNNHSIYWISD